MESILTDTIKFGVALLSIINPIGAIPIFLSITREHGQEEIKKISSSCAVAIFITILISLLIGQHILVFFGISIASFRIGGGFLLFTMALSMLQAKNNNTKLNKKEMEFQDPNEVGIVPLAIPLLAGPGAISTSIIKAESLTGTGTWVGIIIVLAVIALLVKLVLNFSRTIGEKLGTLGLNVMTRIMGLILMALSVEFVTGGLKELFPALARI